MRVVAAAVVALLMGTASAVAQDMRNDAPGQKAAAAAKPAAKPQAKPQTKPESKPKPAEAKKPAPKAAEPKPDPKAKPKPTQAAKPAETPAAPATTGNAFASTPAPAADNKPAPPAGAGVRESYAAIPFPERMAIQSDLVWTGDYNGLVNGEYSDRLADAVKNFQKRLKTKPTGVLNPQERNLLTASAKPKQSEVGWRLIEDPVTGARLGLPTKLAPQSVAGPNGTHWTSAQGQVQIETFRINTGATLEAVFEQQKREPPQRKVGYNVLRPDFFVVSGTQGLKKFYVRGSAKDGEVRGITILYDQATDGTMDPVVVAMSSAFVPFLAGNAGAGALQRKVEYGSGMVVSAAGHVIAAAPSVEGCQVIAIPGHGNAERIAEDKASDLALLRIYGAQKLVPVGLIGGGASSGQITLVGIADPQAQGGGAAVTAVASKLGTANALAEAPALGFSGAAALDSQGRVAGLVVLKPAVVAGAASEPQALIVTRERITNFLEAQYVAPASGAAGIDAAKASVVRVICVRK